MFADGASTTFVENSVFANNFTVGQLANGTAMYISGANTTVSVSGCDFQNNGVKLGPPGGAGFSDDPLNPSIGWYLE